MLILQVNSLVSVLILQLQLQLKFLNSVYELAAVGSSIAIGESVEQFEDEVESLAAQIVAQ